MILLGNKPANEKEKETFEKKIKDAHRWKKQLEEKYPDGRFTVYLNATKEPPEISVVLYGPVEVIREIQTNIPPTEWSKKC